VTLTALRCPYLHPWLVSLSADFRHSRCPTCDLMDVDEARKLLAERVEDGLHFSAEMGAAVPDLELRKAA